MELTHTELRSAWRVFLLEHEVVKNYPLSYAFYGGPAHRDPILDQVIPSLLFINAVAILEDALELVVVSHNITITKPQNRVVTVRDHIKALDDHHSITNGPQLHKILDRRNILAHTAESHASWNELADTIDKIHATLTHLGLTGERPALQYFAEGSAPRYSDEPGVEFVKEIMCGIKENGKIALKVEWLVKSYND